MGHKAPSETQSIFVTKTCARSGVCEHAQASYSWKSGKILIRSLTVVISIAMNVFLCFPICCGFSTMTTYDITLWKRKCIPLKNFAPLFLYSFEISIVSKSSILKVICLDIFQTNKWLVFKCFLEQNWCVEWRGECLYYNCKCVNMLLIDLFQT